MPDQAPRMRFVVRLFASAPISMGHFCAAPQQLRSARVITCGVVALFVLILLPLSLQSQEIVQPASLRGIIRDSQGKTLSGVTVRLQAQDPTQVYTVRTDTQGNYSFAAVPAGIYVLRAEMTAYRSAEIPSFFFAPKEARNLDLILLPATGSPEGSVTPQFFDEPRFAVAGVTDTTTLGGHGSDTIVRTRETLAKETVSLNKAWSSAQPVAISEKEKSLRETLAREPRSFEANRLLGKMLDKDGKAREAIPYLERAAELKPGDYEASYDLALASAHAGNYERARARAQSLLAGHERAELHHLIADSQENMGNSLEAVNEYQRAAELDPREPYVFDWGSELLLHHAPEPAVEVFTKGNRLFPRSVRMLIGLSAALFARGSYDQAVQRICEASNLDPDSPTAYRFMGKMQSAESAPSEEIVARLRRFVAQEPNNAEANYYYAVGLWKLRKESSDSARTAQVEAMLKHAIQLDPKFGDAYLQLGILHSEQKDYSRAISDYQEAIQANPRMEQAHYRLSQVYRQIGEGAKGEAELKRYDEIAKESAHEIERERHQIRQFVYILRDPSPPQIP